MKFFKAFLLFLLGYLPAQAGVNFSVFGGATTGSSNATGTAGYDGGFDLNPQVPIDYYFSMQSGRSQFTTSFVEGLPEAQTKISKYGFSGGLTLLDMISVSYDYVSESINENAVLAKEYTISQGVHYAGLSLTYGYGKRKVFQQKSYIVLTKDIRDDVEFTQDSDRFLLSYRFSDNFSLSLSHTRFKYDKNMENSYSILSNATLVGNNGTDMLSQIYSLLDSTTEISGIYTVGDTADIELSFAKMIDFYNPKSESSDIRVGVMVYQTQSLTWGLGITSTRAGSELTPSRSYDGTLAFAF